MVVPRTQLIVALDYPRWFWWQRPVRRTVARAVDKGPICNGNIQSWAAAPDGPPVLLITRPRQLADFIAS